jgi:tetraacyldisaccharide 4'-kinase
VDRLRWLLLPLSPVYGAAMAIRNWLFEIDVLKTAHVEKPVLSVGNISAGGVGKTPLVELIVDELRARTRVGIVSRGYGRKSHGTIVVQDGIRSLADVHEAGDELRQLADRFPETIVVADERRSRGARMSIALGAQVVVLDDAFQHRYLHRDLDIVVMTADQVIRGEMLLPTGNRREPLNGIDRAHLIAVTRCVDESHMNAVERILQHWNKPVLCLQTRIRTVTHLASRSKEPTDIFSGKRIVAFSGIGSPASFESTLQGLNADVHEHIRYRDHHWYTEKDLQFIRLAFSTSGAEAIVTTEKDAVRIQNGIGAAFLDEVPAYSIGVTQKLARGGASLSTLLRQLVP